MTPGELAFIHVGPWRTFWLQPQPPLLEQNISGGALIPDWAVVDLFSDRDTTNATVTGLININAKVANQNSISFPHRLVPLYALLTNNLGSYPGYSQATAADNIYDVIYDGGADLSTVFPAFVPGAFCFAGQVCEIKGLSKYVTGYPKFVAETPARGIVNIITPRSDVFTVWAIAQTIKKVDLTPANLGSFTAGDIITGETKVQAIVQRYEDPPLSANIKFRTLYYRYITQ